MTIIEASSNRPEVDADFCVLILFVMCETYPSFPTIFQNLNSLLIMDVTFVFPFFERGFLTRPIFPTPQCLQP